MIYYNATFQLVNLSSCSTFASVSESRLLESVTGSILMRRSAQQIISVESII